MADFLPPDVTSCKISIIHIRLPGPASWGYAPSLSVSGGHQLLSMKAPIVMPHQKLRRLNAHHHQSHPVKLLIIHYRILIPDSRGYAPGLRVQGGHQLGLDEKGPIFQPHPKGRNLTDHHQQSQPAKLLIIHSRILIPGSLAYAPGLRVQGGHQLGHDDKGPIFQPHPKARNLTDHN